MVTFADSPGQPNRIAPSYITTSVSRVTEIGDMMARDLSGGRLLAERVNILLRSSDDLMAFGQWDRCPEGTVTGMADEEEGSAGPSRKLAFFKVAHLI